MRGVLKYNLFKIGSTVLTLGVPCTALALSSDFYAHLGDASTAAGAVFLGLIALFFLKDKIAENFKCPSALVVSIVTLTFILIVQAIFIPMVYVCASSVVSCLTDELTFKRLYKKVERKFPKDALDRKKFGFYFTTSRKIGV